MPRPIRFLKAIVLHPALYFSMALTGTVLLLTTSCTKKADGISGDQGPQGPAGTDATLKASAITGYIHSKDQYGNPDSSYSGFTVSTHRNDTLVTATTGEDGHFSLPGLTLGTYDILFSKTGYDSIKTRIIHSGGNEDKFIGIVTVDQSLTTKIIGLDPLLLDNPYPPGSYKILLLAISFDGPPMAADRLRNFDFYFSRSSQVSSQNSEAMATTRGQSAAPYGTNTYNFGYPLQNLANLGYQSGDTVYIRTYIVPVASVWTSWFDYATYQDITYPYPGDSQTTYFIWP